MKHHLTRLASGLPVLTAPVEGTEAVTVIVFAGAGSRYETHEQRGISHFLEHMFFKGGEKYKNTKEVSVALEAVGADFNAFTGKEYAGYYVKAAAAHTELACDVLSDMLLKATFPKEDIERERGVIIEEERMYQDTPMYRAGWDFEELMLGNTPLGWDTIGREEVIMSVTQADFQAHKDRLYTPDNCVVVFAGKVTPEQALALAEKYFGKLEGKKGHAFVPFKDYSKERVFLRSKPTEQAHLVLGVPGVPSTSDEQFAQKLLAIALGGNMSSRMFLRIREAKGMCYYIQTEVDAYLDAGIVSTRAGIDQSRLHEAISLIRHEYELCAKEGFDADELKRAKDYLKGRMTLGFEDSEELGHFFGRQQLLYPKVRTIEEYMTLVDAVTLEQLNGLAKRIFTTENLKLAVIGKSEDKAGLEKLIS
ncbi:MAG: insulinase family protein [Candidatus Peribacteraceae bacterium]|nr:insulinase family protein [Candidatus Peribacteraceae bacterium]